MSLIHPTGDAAEDKAVNQGRVMFQATGHRMVNLVIAVVLRFAVVRKGRIDEGGGSVSRTKT